MADVRLNIKEFLGKDEQKDLLRFLTASSMGDGKSTLIDRLLFDSKKVYEDQLDVLECDSKRMGNAGEHVDHVLLPDGLKVEREQGTVIDVAYRYFSANSRKSIIADTPGHEQYIRNMITGGSTVNLTIILVDVHTGVIIQACRHTYLVFLLGIKHVVPVVNKIDSVDLDKDTFNRIVMDYKCFVEPLGILDIMYIPLSASDNDNVVEKGDHMPRYEGMSLLDCLGNVPIDSNRNYENFRYPVQYVLCPNLDFRRSSDKVVSDIMREGDATMALSSGKASKVKSIAAYEDELEQIFPPQRTTATSKDGIDISRGEMLMHPDNLSICDRNFEIMPVWVDEEAMDVNKQSYIKQITHTTRARVDSIRYKVNVNTMKQSPVDRLGLNEIGRVVFTTGRELFLDSCRRNRQTGSFILIDPITNSASAVGMIIDRVDAKDMVTEDASATLNLSEMGIEEEHYEAIHKVCEESGRQGIFVKRVTEKRQDMGLSEFDKPPINTLIRTDWDTLRKVTVRQQTDEGFEDKYCLMTGACHLLSVLKPVEDSQPKKLADKPLEIGPLFILGYWRSGTTFIHSIFACDKHFGHTATYQTVFPHLMLRGQPFFKKSMALSMSDKCPVDNMELKVDLPREEEPVLSNMMSYTYYNFWFFPKRWMGYRDCYLLFNDIMEEERWISIDTPICPVKVSLWNTNGMQYLSKNPPHTGHVKTLLKMFPNTKFIYLKRNPYTALESIRSFFMNIIRPLRLQDIMNEQIEANFVRVYRRLLYKYEKKKHLALEDDPMGVRFEDPEKDAFATVENIYGSLNLPGFRESRADIERHLGKKKGYKENQYKHENRTARLAEENQDMVLKEWGYSL